MTFPRVVRDEREIERYQFQQALMSAPLSEWASTPIVAGNVKWNAVPCGRPGDAQRRPPWASTIDVLIDKPMPIPSGLVVKKASKMRSGFVQVFGRWQ